MTAAANPRALIVDDEPDICELLSLTLARMGVDSNAVHDLASARRALQGRQDYALCLTDLRLPDGEGTELIEWIQSETPELPVVSVFQKRSRHVACLLVMRDHDESE